MQVTAVLAFFFTTLNFEGNRKLIIGSVALNKNIFQKAE